MTGEPAKISTNYNLSYTGDGCRTVGRLITIRVGGKKNHDSREKFTRKTIGRTGEHHLEQLHPLFLRERQLKPHDSVTPVAFVLGEYKLYNITRRKARI